MQTKLTQKIAAYLSDELKTTVSVDAVHLEFFSSVVLQGLYVKDLHSDTLVYIGEVEADIGLFNLFDYQLHLESVRLKEALFNLKYYEGEEHDNLEFLIEAFSSNDTAQSPWDIRLGSVSLENCRFSYMDEHVKPVESGIDFDHLNISGINIQIDHIKLEEDTIRFNLVNLNLKDQSGFELKKLSAKASVSPAGILMKSMILRTPLTNIKADLTFATDSFANYSNFIDEVKILGNFRDSRINSHDIAFFAPELEDMEPQYVMLNGVVKGKVSNLKGKDLILDINGHSYFEGNIEMKGLPEIDETFIYLSVNNLSTRIESLQKIPIPPFAEKKRLNLPSDLKKLGKLRFRGKFTGFLNDFVAYGDFFTDLGSISTDISLKGEGDDTRYSGFVKTTNFQLGRLFGNDSIFGAVSLNLDVNGKGFSRKKLDARVNGKIDAIELYHYTYRQIQLKGEIADQLFNGDLTIKDKNLDMDFIGSVNLSGKLPELNFLSNINHLNIGKLAKSANIDTSAVFSSTINIDIIGNSIDNINGKFELLNTVYHDQKQVHTMRELSLIAGSDEQKKSLDIESDILDAQIIGNYQLEDLAKSYGVFIEKFIPAIVGSKYDTIRVSEDFNFSLKLKNTKLLSTLFFPTIFIDSGTYITGYYNSLGNQLTLDIQLLGATINETQIYPGFITLQTKENSLFLSSQFKKVKLGDGIYMEDFTIVSETKKNQSVFDFSWSNESKANEGKINITANYLGLKNIEFLFSDSHVKISDTVWNIPENSMIRIDSNAYTFRNVRFYSNRDEIELNGKVSADPGDELSIRVNNFDLHMFNLIVPEKSVKLNGTISGNATLKDPYKNLIFSSNVDFKDFRLNNNLMGEGSVKSFWLQEMDVLHIDGKLLRGPIPTVQVQGNYFPFKKGDNINLTLQLQNTYLKLFQPYVDGILSDLKGLVSGTVKVAGNFENPRLRGNLVLQKAGFTVDYLQTSYTFSDNVIIEPDWIGFDNMVINDMKKGKATVTGTVFHNNFEDFNMDIYLLADKFHILNTTNRDNDLYYGQAFVTGEIDIAGHADNLIIEVNAKTDKSYPQSRNKEIEYTQFNIPLDNPDEAAEISFVNFINTKDSSAKSAVIEDADLTGIQMNFDLEVTTDAEIRLIFDEKVGDVLKSRGNGNLVLEINRRGDFNMFGEYIVDEGDYLFTLQNVINKRFSLQNGGSISWNGDPYSGILDLSAVYKLRARISDLNIPEISGDSSSNYTKRIPVELVLKMENTILSPDISFDIRLPTADENTKSLLYNTLYVGTSGANENVMNKQAFSLLVLNRFTPTDQGLSGSGFGATSSSELLSNQMSNWLSQINRNVDVGFAYRPGDQLSSDQVELGLSTQILKDRVVVDGNVEYGGNQTVSQAQNTNTLVGDITIEYKIREDGKFRVKAFNKSNTNNFLKNNNPYTQGVGIFYKYEFNKKGKKEEDEDLEEENEDEQEEENKQTP